MKTFYYIPKDLVKKEFNELLVGNIKKPKNKPKPLDPDTIKEKLKKLRTNN